MRVYYWISYSLFVLMCAYILCKYILAVQNRPRIQKTDILYQEWFASGRSTKNILTQLGGGGNNCVRLVITKDLLWVTSWFPFSLFAPACDMEHVIPLDWITEVEHNRGFVKGIRLTYVGENGAVRSLELVPKNQEGFLRTIENSLEPSQIKSR